MRWYVLFLALGCSSFNFSMEYIALSANQEHSLGWEEESGNLILSNAEGSRTVYEGFHFEEFKVAINNYGEIVVVCRDESDSRKYGFWKVIVSLNNRASSFRLRSIYNDHEPTLSVEEDLIRLRIAGETSEPYTCTWKPGKRS